MLKFDVVFPSILSIIVAISILAYQKFKKPLGSLLEDRKITIRDAVIMVVTMGVMVSIMVFIPSQAIQVTFIAAYSYMLFIFSYTALEKWYLALLPPIAFVASYLLFWNLTIFNLFAIAFSIIIIIYMSSLFSWKTVCVFAVLLTVMDVIQVFGTGFMVESAKKMIDMRLPVLVLLPTFPTESLMGLGLGDIFLAGLLAVQTASRHGQKAGMLSALTIGLAMFVFEVALFNSEFASYFPATIVVISGWFAGLGIFRLVDYMSGRPETGGRKGK